MLSCWCFDEAPGVKLRVLLRRAVINLPWHGLVYGAMSKGSGPTRYFAGADAGNR